jgi:hypothetical protein
LINEINELEIEMVPEIHFEDQVPETATYPAQDLDLGDSGVGFAVLVVGDVKGCGRVGFSPDEILGEVREDLM